MAVLRDIAKNLGIIPRLLARRDEKQSNELDRLMGENEALRGQMEAAQGAPTGMKKGGKVKKMAAGGSASKRADGCAIKGKTRGKMV
jgi:hypothetical protein